MGKARYKDHRMVVDARHSIQNAAARQIELFGETNRREKRAYYCPLCNGYHFTSQDKRSANTLKGNA